MKKYGTYGKLHKIIAAAAVMIIIIAVILQGSLAAPLSSYADTSYVTAFENQNVLDDLDGSTIAGNAFDLSDYPYNENGRPQVLNLVEFGYSYYSYYKDDYNLYVYVYNPEGSLILDNSDVNQIEMSIGSLVYSSYSLEVVNYSTKSGYEGLFYKFKVVISDSLRTSILSSLNQTAREYTVGAIELNSLSYEVGSTYTYSGFSFGYGSSAATESSLTCSVDDYYNYLTLDVTHTVYRPEGDYYEGEQSQLDSVYFSVPNSYFENYGELTNIACEWYEYVTNPILITENVNIYYAMNNLYGRTLDYVSDGYDYLFNFVGNTDCSWFSKSVNGYYLSNLAYEDEKISWFTGSMEFSANTFSQGFAGVFYTGGESYDGYSVSAEDVLAKLQSYSQKLGDTSVCGKYAVELFDSDYEASGYSGIVDVGINSTRELFVNNTNKTWWQNIFGGYSVTTDYDTIPALLTFSDSDLFSDYSSDVHISYDDLLNYDISAIAELYKIGEADVDDFVAACKKAQNNDETVVLMRFSSSTYVSMPCAQARTVSDDDSKTTLAKECYSQWNDEDYSAYVCQEIVYLNFDIISLTFTLNNVETVIPVVMSPVDLASDTSSPLDEDYGSSGSSSWWQKVLAVIALVLLCVLFTPLLPYIAKFIVWIISLPVKLVKSVIEAIKKSSNKNKKE